MSSPVLIGRQPLMAALERFIDGVQHGRGRLVLITGEAGIGKSRLLAETKLIAAQSGIPVIEGACFPGDQVSPYALLIDLLRARLARLSTEERAAIAGPFARDLSPLCPDLIPSDPDLTLPAFDPEQERRRLVTAFVHCLIGTDHDRPNLLAVEDLHWCDEASLEVLLQLARQATSRPLLLIGTYRNEEINSGLRVWLAQLDRDRLADELTVSPLNRAEVAAMIRAIAGTDQDVSDELVAAVQSLAEGNPFYVEELVPAIAGRDRPETDGPRRLPRSLQDLVQQRIERLSPAAREVLILAAVMGRRFDFRILQHATGIDRRRLIGLIKELVAAHLVVEESREAFAFRHALTREAVYADLLTIERAELHRVVGEAAEHLAGDSLDHQLADLAGHFAEAGIWDKTLDYARRAAERALRLGAPRAAVADLDRALEAADRLHRQGNPELSPAALADLRRERGQAYEVLGDFERALGDGGAVLTLARTLQDPELEWQALLDLGLLWSSRNYEQAGHYFQQAIALARALDDPARLAHALNRLGNWQVNTADPRGALPLHHEALAIFAELGDQSGLAGTLDLLGTASYLAADLPASLAFYERAMPILREVNDRRGLVYVLAMLATRAGAYELPSPTATSDDFAEGVRLGEEAVALAQVIEWPAGEAFSRINLAVSLGPRGEYELAITQAELGLLVATEIEHQQWMAAAHEALGQIYLDLLAMTEARHHLESALALARTIRSTFWEQLLTGCLAWTYVQSGDPGRAAALLGPPSLDERPVQSLGEQWVVFGHAHVALAQQRPADTLHLLDRLLPAGGSGSAAEPPHPALARAAALIALERHDEAEAILQAVCTGAERQRIWPIGWRANRALGNLHRSRGQNEAARRAFSTARAIIEELAQRVPAGSVRKNFLEQATARLPRAYRLSPPRVAATRSGGLSAREREVAVRISRGLTNREIAGDLFIGERTVEYHVGNILSKLGATSRREVAAWASERGLVDREP